jgi:hypothetical protein
MQKVFIALLLVVCVPAIALSEGWQRFNSSGHFSVRYPGSWFRHGASIDRLQLLSSRGGAEGIVIKRGQAEITVMEAKASFTQTLAKVIAYYTQNASVLSRGDISQEAGKGGCIQLREVISKEQAIPPTDSPISVPYIINTDFFCEVDGRKIVTLLRNWEGDKRQEEYQQTALRITESIKPLR